MAFDLLQTKDYVVPKIYNTHEDQFYFKIFHAPLDETKLKQQLTKREFEYEHDYNFFTYYTTPEYRFLNSLLLSKADLHEHHADSICRHLYEAILKYSKTQREQQCIRYLYRASAHLASDTNFIWYNFVSTSKDESVVLERSVSNNQPYVYVIEVSDFPYVEIENYSYNQWQQEVLLPPGLEFTVIKKHGNTLFLKYRSNFEKRFYN